MWLKAVQLLNYRCFKNIALSFDPRLTVLVAENGQGKTAILEAVACLLGRFVSRFGVKSVPCLKETDFRDEWGLDDNGKLVRKVREPAMTISALADVTGYSVWNRYVATVSWEMQRARDNTAATKRLIKSFGVGLEGIREFADAFIQSDNESKPVPYPIIAFYGTERFIPRSPLTLGESSDKTFRRQDAFQMALNGTLNYKNLVGWLRHLEDHQVHEIVERRDFQYVSLAKRTIQMVLDLVMPGFFNLKFRADPDRLEVDFRNGEESRRLCVDQQLSDGQKIVLMLVLDLVSRIIQANEMLPDMSPEALLATRGIVLIDEIDLHLHPSWQQHVLVDINRAFPNMQFIVTTHSPHVVSSVPRESLRIITERGVVPFAQPTQGVDVSDILRGIFGTSPSPQNVEIVNKLNRLIDLTSEGLGEMEEWRGLYNELVNYYGEEYGPLAGAVMHKNFLKRLEKERADA